MLSWENTATVVPAGRRLGEWLREQRQARAWSRPEMARRLIKTTLGRAYLGGCPRGGRMGGISGSPWRRGPDHFARTTSTAMATA